MLRSIRPKCSAPEYRRCRVDESVPRAVRRSIRPAHPPVFPVLYGAHGFLTQEANSRTRHFRIALLELDRDGTIGARARPMAGPIPRSESATALDGARAGAAESLARQWLAESSREDNWWAFRDPPMAKPTRALGRRRPSAATTRHAPPGPTRPGSCGLIDGRCRRGPIPRRPWPESRRSAYPIPPPRPDEAARRPRRGRPPRAGFRLTRLQWGH